MKSLILCVVVLMGIVTSAKADFVVTPKSQVVVATVTAEVKHPILNSLCPFCHNGKCNAAPVVVVPAAPVVAVPAFESSGNRCGLKLCVPCEGRRHWRRCSR